MARSSDLSRDLDRYAGAAISMLLAPILNRHRSLPENPKTIGILQPTAIGDTLIGSGCIAALQERYPQAQITIYHGPSNAAGVALLPGSFKRVQTGFTNPFKAVPSLRAAKHDLIVDLTPWPNMTALCARLASPVTVGFSPDVNPGRKRLFDIVTPHSGERHELENMAEMASHFGGAAPKMTINRTEFSAPDGTDCSRLVLCHLSAGGSRARDKSWPGEYWVKLVKALIEAGYQVGFTGVKADEARVLEVIEKAGVSAPDAISLCGVLKLHELAELLANVPLLVTVDTGVLHLAAAVDGRSIGLHGPTLSTRWGSRSPNAIGLQSPHPNSGYISYGFELAPGDPDEVMAALLPETVIELALTVLQEQCDVEPHSSVV